MRRQVGTGIVVGVIVTVFLIIVDSEYLALTEPPASVLMRVVGILELPGLYAGLGLFQILRRVAARQLHLADNNFRS